MSRAGVNQIVGCGGRDIREIDNCIAMPHAATKPTTSLGGAQASQCAKSEFHVSGMNIIQTRVPIGLIESVSQQPFARPELRRQLGHACC